MPAFFAAATSTSESPVRNTFSGASSNFFAIARAGAGSGLCGRPGDSPSTAANGTEPKRRRTVSTASSCGLLESTARGTARAASASRSSIIPGYGRVFSTTPASYSRRTRARISGKRFSSPNDSGSASRTSVSTPRPTKRLYSPTVRGGNPNAARPRLHMSAMSSSVSASVPSRSKMIPLRYAFKRISSFS